MSENYKTSVIEDNNFKKYQLATGYISSTRIPFDIAKIALLVEAKGYVKFLDSEENLLASVNLPKQTGGKEVYSEVLYKEESDKITLKFPIVEWIDNYPNCDGEHDRWDTRTIGYHTIIFDIQTNKIIMEDNA